MKERRISPIRLSLPTPLKTAQTIAQFCDDKKAEDITILDMRKVANLCDYFVICSASTDRQVSAIADHVEEELKILGNKISFRDGYKSADWVVLDAGDVVVHVFQKELRDFYRLEYLWQEAKIVNWNKKK